MLILPRRCFHEIRTNVLLGSLQPTRAEVLPVKSYSRWAMVHRPGRTERVSRRCFFGRKIAGLVSPPLILPRPQDGRESRATGTGDAVGPSPIQKSLSTMEATRPRVGWMTSEAPSHPPAKERLFRRARRAEAGPRRAGAAASEGLGGLSGPGRRVSSGAPGAASSGIARAGIAAANRSGSRSSGLGGRPGAPREAQGQGPTERRREVIHLTPAKTPGHARGGKPERAGTKRPAPVRGSPSPATVRGTRRITPWCLFPRLAGWDPGGFLPALPSGRRGPGD